MGLQLHGASRELGEVVAAVGVQDWAEVGRELLHKRGCTPAFFVPELSWAVSTSVGLVTEA